MKTSKTVAKLLFVVGALVYLVGLWISCPLLSGKGYFLGVLMTATFGNYAYLRAEKLGQLDNFFTHICQLVALITIGLLFIGVLNAPINAYEMVICKRTARAVLTGMCYSAGSAMRHGSSSLTRLTGQSAMTPSTWRR
ncbi:inner membrane protein YiaB [Escherichia coli]|uniref:inner membrane protein YiaB n=5 Tax=Enterobacteriaceae TaxID=543 RepID=UPI0003EF0A8D|nr:inner membrane protein YiaB [Escherichia coli]